MKNKKSTLSIALAVAMSALMLTTPAAADEAAKTEPTKTVIKTEDKNLTFISIPDKKFVKIKSFAASNNNDITPIFDLDTETGTEFAFDRLDYPKAVSVTVSAETPCVADTFAIKINHDENTTVTVTVHATNDTLLNDWRTLDIITPANMIDGYNVFSVKEFAREFKYYRFDFTVRTGTTFTLTELSLYTNDNSQSDAESDDHKLAPDYGCNNGGKRIDNFIPTRKF